MSKQPIKNMGASVRARLVAMSRERHQTFQLVLTNYVLERLLYRLSQTEHRTRFILKGAMLLTKWFDDPLRPTQDIDFLGFGDDDPDEMVKTFRESAPSRSTMESSSMLRGVQIDSIRQQLEYGGLRIKTNATVDAARVRIFIDTGFWRCGRTRTCGNDLPTTAFSNMRMPGFRASMCADFGPACARLKGGHG
jgi:Nucleotidyl transferase AbiEii toxin, Type IV TA system